MYPYGTPYPYYPSGKATEAPPIPEHRKALAKRAGATHLAKDGLTAYTNRLNTVRRAHWSDEDKRFGAWGPLKENEGLPEGAIEL